MRFLSFLLIVVILSSFTTSQIENTFLAGFKSNNQSTITQSVKKISASKSSVEKDAFLGGLEMKLSQYEKTNGEKMKKFKSGKTKLEGAITKKPNSVNFRFIRFVIQEKAPKVLKYNKQMTKDAEFIKKNYTKASAGFKSMIVAHSKKSDKLNL